MKSALSVKIKKLEEYLEENKTKLNTIRTNYNVLLKANYVKKMELAKVLGEIVALKTKLDEFKTTVNPYVKLIKENKSKVNLLKRALKYEKEALIETTRLFEAYKYWTKGFKEIKLMLTSEALQEFEIQINNSLSKLGLNDWEIKLDIDSETKAGTIRKGFNVLINSPYNDKAVPFECWSGGEGQRLRLATTLGFIDFIKNRRGSSCDILVFDEPTQFLSEQGIDDLISALREKAKEDKLKLFLIDHRALNTFGGFSGIITVTKNDNGSNISINYDR
jgi:DNA repair exonuclease SbcCD ATPase subunit